MNEENNELNFINVVIDSDEIYEFMFNALVERGMVPKEEDVEVITDIVFDFFIHKGIIEETFDGEVDDNEEEF